MLKLNFIVCRPLVDSATDLGDREGVFLNSCVTIVVGGGGRGSSGRGTVVQQVCEIGSATQKSKGTGGLVSIMSYRRPSLMIIASWTQFHVERPWDQRPFSIVS